MLKSKSSTACLLAYISPSFVFYSRFGGTINKAAQCYCPQALSRTGTLWEEQELGLPQVSLQGCRPRENLWTILLSRPEKEKKNQTTTGLKAYGCQKWATHFSLSWTHPEFLFFLVYGAVSGLWKWLHVGSVQL